MPASSLAECRIFQTSRTICTQLQTPKSGDSDHAKTLSMNFTGYAGWGIKSRIQGVSGPFVDRSHVNFLILAPLRCSSGDLEVCEGLEIGTMRQCRNPLYVGIKHSTQAVLRLGSTLHCCLVRSSVTTNGASWPDDVGHEAYQTQACVDSRALPEKECVGLHQTSAT